MLIYLQGKAVVCVVVCTKMNVFTYLNISLLLNVDRVSTGFELSIFLTEKPVKV